MVQPLSGAARNRFASILMGKGAGVPSVAVPGAAAQVPGSMTGPAMTATGAAAMQGPGPLQLANQQAFLTQQLQDASQAEPQDIGSGIADLGNTALAGYLLNRASGKEDTARSEAAARANAYIAAALAGGGDTQAGLAAASDPWANPGQSNLIAQLLTRGPKDDPLVEVVKDGVKIRVRQSQAEGMQADYLPKPEGPNSAIAKIQADVAAGFITPEQGRAAIAKETYIAPQAPREPGVTYTDITDAQGNVIGQRDSRGKVDYFSQGITVGADGTVQIGGNGAKPPTEDQSKNAQLYQEILPEVPIFMKNFDALTKTTDQLAGMGPQALSNLVTTPEYQQATNALGHIIANNLYSLSGATITPAEANRRASLLLPTPGESAASIADKKQRIRALLDGMRTRAGKAAIDLPQPDYGDLVTGGPGGAGRVKRHDAQGNEIP